MLSLIVTMGISGSGKSHYAEVFENDCGYIRVCMDELRKLYTGDISDQTQNRRVADNAFAITEFLLYKGKDVVFDGTNTRADTRNRLIKMAKQFGAQTHLEVLMDSEDLGVCQSRVRNDLSSGKDRSNTLKEASIMERQHEAFMTALKAIDKEGWDSIAKMKAEY